MRGYSASSSVRVRSFNSLLRAQLEPINPIGARRKVDPEKSPCVFVTRRGVIVRCFRRKKHDVTPSADVRTATQTIAAFARDSQCQQPVARAAGTPNVISKWLEKMARKKTPGHWARFLKRDFVHIPNHCANSRKAQVGDLPCYSLMQLRLAMIKIETGLLKRRLPKRGNHNFKLNCCRQADISNSMALSCYPQCFLRRKLLVSAITTCGFAKTDLCRATLTSPTRR